MFEDQNDEDGEDIEMMDAEDDGTDDDEENDDVEEVADGSDEEGDDNASNESGEEGDADELEAFDAKLAEALGTHRADKDIDAKSDTSEADMDDDQMEALDEQLVKVFKARNQSTIKKKDKKDARKNMLNFKNRVLDLLEIYVRKCNSSILALQLIVPLLQLARKSKVQQIASRASNVLREYTKHGKPNNLPALPKTEVQSTWELLRSIHRGAMHSGPGFYSASCSQASLLVVKILVAHDKTNINGIVDVYAATRKEQLLSSKCHVQPSFFSDWNNWCVSAAKQLKG